jgi:hypothetical protein
VINSRKDVLNFDNYLLGDTYTDIVSDALCCEELQSVKQLSMANNRLTFKGIKSLMSKAQQKLKKLDFSQN